MVPYDVRLRDVFPVAFVSEKAAESDLGRCNQDWLSGIAVGLALIKTEADGNQHIAELLSDEVKKFKQI